MVNKKLKVQFKINIYLKSLRKPLKVFCPNLEWVKRFFAILQNAEGEFVNVDDMLIFNKNEFKLATIEEIKIK